MANLNSGLTKVVTTMIPLGLPKPIEGTQSNDPIDTYDIGLALYKLT